MNGGLPYPSDHVRGHSPRPPGCGCAINRARLPGLTPSIAHSGVWITHSHTSMAACEQYIEIVARNPVARRVKIVDLEENLADNRRTPLARGNGNRIRRYEVALDRLCTTWPEAVVDCRKSHSPQPPNHTRERDEVGHT